VEPIVRETPPFARALSFASMSTPGPFEKSKEAYYNITLPEPDWTPQQVEEHMSLFNYPQLEAISIHEAYPGHYLQRLFGAQAPSKVRKLMGAGSNSEGWAHYVEEMMLEQGYGSGDPKLRLGQLLAALQRNARYIVALEMHTGAMTFDEAVNFFVKEAYMTKTNATREARRGTMDPTYLVYTLGKLEILKLREDYKEHMGAKFSLREFHDKFLREGTPPVKIVRKALFGFDTPVFE
jgi:uncharacterized protein (DUF885 family)